MPCTSYWRYPGAISHVQGSLSRSLVRRPQKALYWFSESTSGLTALGAFDKKTSLTFTELSRPWAGIYCAVMKNTYVFCVKKVLARMIGNQAISWPKICVGFYILSASCTTSCSSMCGLVAEPIDEGKNTCIHKQGVGQQAPPRSRCDQVKRRL